MDKREDRRRGLRLADIPELARPVGLHGQFGQAEVGGPICFGIAVALSVRN
jgi:hypothetical protein